MNATDLINSITNFAKSMEQFNSSVEELQKSESEYDRRQDILLHKIEKENFNACDGYKMAKELKELRRQRREVKDSIAAFQSFNDRFYKTNKGLSMSLFKTARAMKEAGWDGRIFED